MKKIIALATACACLAPLSASQAQKLNLVQIFPADHPTAVFFDNSTRQLLAFGREATGFDTTPLLFSLMDYGGLNKCSPGEAKLVQYAFRAGANTWETTFLACVNPFGIGSIVGQVEGSTRSKQDAPGTAYESIEFDREVNGQCDDHKSLRSDLNADEFKEPRSGRTAAEMCYPDRNAIVYDTPYLDNTVDHDSALSSGERVWRDPNRPNCIQVKVHLDGPGKDKADTCYMRRSHFRFKIRAYVVIPPYGAEIPQYLRTLPGAAAPPPAARSGMFPTIRLDDK